MLTGECPPVPNILSTAQWRIQDFPEEGAPTYNFAKFSQKLHEIERISTRGGTSLAPPLDPPLQLLHILIHWVNALVYTVPPGTPWTKGTVNTENHTQWLECIIIHTGANMPTAKLLWAHAE